MTPLQALQSGKQPALLFVEQAVEQRDGGRQFVGLGLPGRPLLLPARAIRGPVKVAVRTGPTLQPARDDQLTQGILDRDLHECLQLIGKISESAGQAVFLSYASQDAAVAARIAEALRQGGMEVWLDQGGGLVGGDAWDRKSRGQIATCALFVPLVATNTQSRKEGYFRLQWHLAEERARLMAKGVPFIVPVSIDGTSERGALVPDAFLAVQWTRLPGGEAPPAFVARVGKLQGVVRAEPTPAGLGAAPVATRPTSALGKADLADPVPPSTQFARMTEPRAGRARRWQLATTVLFVMLAGLAFFHFRQKPPPQQTLRYTVSDPPDCAGITGFAISPDVKLLVMVAHAGGKRQLWLRSLDGLETKPIPSTEEATGPFWSPDSRYIGFFAQDRLKKFAVSGGTRPSAL